MKTYKHKVTEETITYENGVIKSGNCCIEIGCEPSSEFWEEIKEKDFEILSYLVYDKDLATKRENGNYLGEKCELSDTCVGATWKEVLNFWDENLHKIHSVKRVSDGEVFTIGDKVVRHADKDCPNPCMEVRTIRKFHYNYNAELCFETDFERGFMVKLFSKVKTTLFTTEDSIDIFEGDKYYSVNKKYWVIDEPEKTCKINYETYHKNTNNFSTKEKAEEYIRLNKPRYSLNDIKESLKGYEFTTIENIFKNLKYGK